MNYDLIIIGGGASGLCTAIKAKRDNNSVLVIEHTDRTVKKILQTGNGKCNLTNSFCKAELFDKNPEKIKPFFTSGDEGFVLSVISSFDADDTVDFFESLGILTINKNGYIYPISEQASSINDILRNTCNNKNIDIITGYEPQNITKTDNLFDIDGKYKCSSLVLATGGMAAPKTGSDGSGYRFAESFGHRIISPLPALTGLKCNDGFFREISGVRCDAVLSLFDGKKEVMSVSGNLQFTDYGISGIPIFQISSVAGRLFENKRKLKIKVDLLPEVSEESLYEFLYENIENKRDDILLGIVNKKLSSLIYKIAGDKGCRQDEFFRSVCSLVKNFYVTPISLRSFDDAQVTSGGVATDDINSETMESKLVNGLYFTGEIIDVNGICGGYNLQWAWSTAHIAAQSINNDKNKSDQN